LQGKNKSKFKLHGTKNQRRQGFKTLPTLFISETALLTLIIPTAYFPHCLKNGFPLRWAIYPHQ
jgi:hypothetical protein